jgi:hypothetical protein
MPPFLSKVRSGLNCCAWDDISFRRLAWYIQHSSKQGILLLYTMANAKGRMQGLDVLIAVKGMHVRLHWWSKLISTGNSFISVTKNVLNLLDRDTITTDSL